MAVQQCLENIWTKPGNTWEMSALLVGSAVTLPGMNLSELPGTVQWEWATPANDCDKSISNVWCEPEEDDWKVSSILFCD